MEYKQMTLAQLFPDWKGSAPTSTVTLYQQRPSPEIDPQRKYPCILLCPGGGYHFTSDREAEPVALRFLANGYSVAVLRYSAQGYGFPVQLCEASLVMAYLRRNAQALDIDPNRLFTCGFSAGGHLAGSLSNLWNSPVLAEAIDIQPGENRPNGAVLCYPVITSGAFAHRGSFDNLLQTNPSPQLAEQLSLEHSAGSHCPPTFLWHTADDGGVPVENSLLYAQALSRYKVPFALHVYPKGVHGLSLADQSTAAHLEHISPMAAGWFQLALDFLETI